MTPTEVQQTISEFSTLWPKARRTPKEWVVFSDKAERINIDFPQAQAALANLLATSSKYPRVADLLRVLKQAETLPQRMQAASTPQQQHAQDLYLTDEHGMTSFERRVRDDPKFRVYARKAGRLSAERLDEIRAKAARATEVPFA